MKIKMLSGEAFASLHGHCQGYAYVVLLVRWADLC